MREKGIVSPSVQDDERQRRGQELGVVPRRVQQGDHEEVGRAHDQVDARVQHQVDLAHVVGGPGHRVADGLARMEGHALAEQARVELVAGIALESLAYQLAAEVAAQLQHRAHRLRQGHPQGDSRDRGRVGHRALKRVERTADQDRHHPSPAETDPLGLEAMAQKPAQRKPGAEASQVGGPVNSGGGPSIDQVEGHKNQGADD